MKYTTIAVMPEVKEKFEKFKDFLRSEKKVSDSQFVDFLIESNLKYSEYLFKLKEEGWKKEYTDLCMKETPQISYTDFRLNKIKEELSDGRSNQ